MLIRFDEFCVELFPNEITITKDMLNMWAVKKAYEAPGTLRNRVTVVSHLAQYMSSLGIDAYVYPTNELPKEPKYIPHIFSEEEGAVKKLPPKKNCNLTPKGWIAVFFVI